MTFNKIIKTIFGTCLRMIKLFFVATKSIFLRLKHRIPHTYKNTEPVVLFIKHARGGGTEQFVKNYINANPDKKILVLSNYSYYFDFFILLVI